MSTVCAIASGGHTFAVDRVEHSDSGDGSGAFITFALQLHLSEDIEVVRSGSDCTGPWGVDFFKPSGGRVLAAVDARRWLHAILGR